MLDALKWILFLALSLAGGVLWLALAAVAGRVLHHLLN